VFAAVLLAAGGSRRYGRANKLLQPIAGRPLIAWSLALVASAPAQRTIVVVGADHARTMRAVRRWGGSRVTIRRARNWRSGLGASLATGIGALRPVERAAFVFLGDMPAVPADLAGRMARALAPSVQAVRATSRGRPGHPVLVRAAFARAALLAGDRGLAGAITGLPPGQRVELPSSPRAVIDVDRPADMMRMRLRMRGKKARAKG
jgi:molybdenum cofactor cytidylyltransferase